MNENLATQLPFNSLTHLQEAESIQIMREVVAETEKPVVLHLARKAFYPSQESDSKSERRPRDVYKIQSDI